MPENNTTPAPDGATLTLHSITATVCSACLHGEGGECHTPGCVFIYHDGPAPAARGCTLRQLLTDVGTVDGVCEQSAAFATADLVLAKREASR